MKEGSGRVASSVMKSRTPSAITKSTQYPATQGSGTSVASSDSSGIGSAGVAAHAPCSFSAQDTLA